MTTDATNMYTYMWSPEDMLLWGLVVNGMYCKAGCRGFPHQMRQVNGFRRRMHPSVPKASCRIAEHDTRRSPARQPSG